LVAPVTITRLPVKLPSRLGVQGNVTATKSNGRFYVSRVSSVNMVCKTAEEFVRDGLA
jgi:hypothetical protein